MSYTVPISMNRPVQTLDVSYYQQIHQEADKDKNGQVTQEELQQLKEYRDGIRFFQYDPEFEKGQVAMNAMIQNFSLFANHNRRETGPYRTGLIGPEDNVITADEITAVASRDGNAGSISQRDLGPAHGPRHCDYPNHNPGPFLPPTVPNPPFAPQLKQLLTLLLFSLLQQNSGGSNGFPWQLLAGNSNNNPWFS